MSGPLAMAAEGFGTSGLVNTVHMPSPSEEFLERENLPLRSKRFGRSGFGAMKRPRACPVLAYRA